MISSVIPSLKYSFSGSALMLASGSTTMDFSAGATPTGVVPDGVRSRCSATSSASANSAAVGKRSTGVRASARTIAWSTASGTSRIARACGTGARNRLEMMACALGPVKGCSPVSISYRTQPRE